MTDGGEWVPAFDGQRPPFGPGNDVGVRFAPGNTVGLTHSSYSTLALNPRAADLADELRAVVPAYSPADEPTVRLLALTLARIERATAALDQLDETTAEKPLGPYLVGDAAKLQRLREDSRGWINTARRLLNDLGCSPTSRAKLGLDLLAGESIREQLMRRYSGDAIEADT